MAVTTTRGRRGGGRVKDLTPESDLAFAAIARGCAARASGIVPAPEIRNSADFGLADNFGLAENEGLASPPFGSIMGRP